MNVYTVFFQAPFTEMNNLRRGPLYENINFCYCELEFKMSYNCRTSNLVICYWCCIAVFSRFQKYPRLTTFYSDDTVLLYPLSVIYISTPASRFTIHGVPITLNSGGLFSVINRETERRNSEMFPYKAYLNISSNTPPLTFLFNFLLQIRIMGVVRLGKVFETNHSSTSQKRSIGIHV